MNRIITFPTKHIHKGREYRVAKPSKAKVAGTCLGLLELLSITLGVVLLVRIAC